MHTAPTTQISFYSINYNKSATIPRSAEATTTATTTTRHHPYPHQSKEATQRRTMTRKQSAMVVGSSSRSAFGSQRAAIKQKHRRSLRYTRTLDIILEETQQQQQQQQQCQHQQYQTPNAEEQHISLFRSPCSSHRLEQQQQDRSISCESSPNTAAAAAVSMTDFWHSMRSMKKSATIVSLDSLLAAEDSNVTATNTSPESMEALGACVVSEDEENYDNFLDDWDL